MTAALYRFDMGEWCNGNGFACPSRAASAFVHVHNKMMRAHNNDTRQAKAPCPELPPSLLLRLRQEPGDQVGGDATAVFGAGADVVDGLDVS